MQHFWNDDLTLQIPLCLLQEQGTICVMSTVAGCVCRHSRIGGTKLCNLLWPVYRVSWSQGCRNFRVEPLLWVILNAIGSSLFCDVYFYGVLFALQETSQHVTISSMRNAYLLFFFYHLVLRLTSRLSLKRH